MKREMPLALLAPCFAVFIALYLGWNRSYHDLYAGPGWKGTLDWLGLGIVVVPNWVTLAIAVVIAALAWMRHKSADTNPNISSSISFYGAAYGVAHTLGYILLATVQRGKPGAGAVLSLAAFVIILVMLRKSSVPVSTP